MKILFFTPTAEIGASSRYRVYQYIEYLEKKGHDCTVKPFLTDDLYKKWKSNSLGNILLKMPIMIIKRFFDCLFVKKYDVVVIHRDIFPFGPLIFEKIIRIFNKNIVIDIDDAVFTTETEEISGSNKLLYKLKYGTRFNASFKDSSMVICGNDFLEDYVSKYNVNTVIVPTVVDTNHIIPREYSIINKKSPNYVTIGWVGNPGNSSYLNQLTTIFSEINKFNLDVKIKLKFIGAKEEIKNSFPDFDVEVEKWSLDTEYEMLRQCDIGIMPLNDSNWSKGKCGLKLLQYMAVGIPVIASPIGVNNEIVINDYNGFLAYEKDEWVEKITTLIQNPELRMKLGVNGRSFVEKFYSLEKWAENLNQILSNNFK
ncbi:glycosyltransferase family 4 protein [Niallia sp.]|uniref:glycosyltransferase family 4 protein n=1 Tax=Niallia sp. TaxID=2837523 RepID=UPI00289C4540|nr:glycosyltransferase family 4 protein [Niallia sp.]